MNLTPLFSGLSKGLSGYRQGQREREDRDQEQKQRELRDMLAIYGEKRAARSETEESAHRKWQREQAMRPETPPAPQVIQTDQGIFTLGRDGTLTPLANPQGGTPLRQPAPVQAPRNIDPLSPQGISATEKRERVIARIRQQFPTGRSDDTPAFLRDDAVTGRAAQFSREYTDPDLGKVAGLPPKEAASKARTEVGNQREAAYNVERDELLDLYRQAYENAEGDAATQDKATRAFMAAQEQMMKKYKLGRP